MWGFAIPQEKFSLVYKRMKISKTSKILVLCTISNFSHIFIFSFSFCIIKKFFHSGLLYFPWICNFKCRSSFFFFFSQVFSGDDSETRIVASPLKRSLRIPPWWNPRGGCWESHQRWEIDCIKIMFCCLSILIINSCFSLSYEFLVY